jgi:hypothetical protein
MKPKHTDGPWKAVKPLFYNPNSVRHIVDADNRLIARVDFANAVQSQNEAIGNAVLISQAPSMFSMLNEALREVEAFEKRSGVPQFSSGISRARQVLAAATDAP